MNKKIYDFERKYAIQDELLEMGSLEGLDERTLHETIKAMLINTNKDCIKYENFIDSAMNEINRINAKEDKNDEDYKKIKILQDKLRMALHCSKIAEESLGTLLFQMLTTDDIKSAFIQEIPDLYINLYYMLDLEDEIVDIIITELSESFEELSYKKICSIINSCIEDVVNNAEDYIENIKDMELYDEFVRVRDEWKKIKEEEENG